MRSQTLVLGLLVLLVVLLPISVTLVSSADVNEAECSGVRTLLSSCYYFITYGFPDPYPGSPCCSSMMSLKMVSDNTVENRRFTCRCLMNLFATYTPNAYALATLPDFCGVSLGYIVDPNTDCNLVTSDVYVTMQDIMSLETNKKRAPYISTMNLKSSLWFGDSKPLFSFVGVSSLCG